MSSFMPAAEIFVSEHRKPPQSVTLAPSSCGNCARPLYVQTGTKQVCPPCASAFDLGAMVWVCMECETARKYGSAPLNLRLAEIDRTEKQLKCLRCCRVTAHEFFEVSRGPARN
jgi:hypothetical protein